MKCFTFGIFCLYFSYTDIYVIYGHIRNMHVEAYKKHIRNIYVSYMDICDDIYVNYVNLIYVHICILYGYMFDIYVIYVKYMKCFTFGIFGIYISYTDIYVHICTYMTHVWTYMSKHIRNIQKTYM